MTEPQTISIEATGARVDVFGTGACEGFNIRASGKRVVLAGLPTVAIAAALCGRGKVVAGALRIDGRDVARGEHFGHVGIAPLDLPFPSRETVLTYVSASFRLAGLSGTEADAAAKRELGELGLLALLSRRAHSLAPAERRAVVIAQAMLPSSIALFVESPLAGLDMQAARFVLGVLAQACRSRAVIATALRTDPASPERDLLLGADCASLLSTHGGGWMGEPDALLRGDKLLSIVVRGHGDQFMERAAAASIELQGEYPRWTARLPPSTGTGVLLRAAREAESTLIEMIPIWE